MKVKILSIIIIAMISILGIFGNNNMSYALLPSTGGAGGGTSNSTSNGTSSSSSGNTTVDSIMDSADNFLQKGKVSIDEQELHTTSNFLYNLLLGVGIIVAVVVGMIIGIKYMTSSVEGKAELKQAAIGYAAGCLVIFGAFGIWKLVINIFSSL